jgi:hypothetical protein
MNFGAYPSATTLGEAKPILYELPPSREHAGAAQFPRKAQTPDLARSRPPGPILLLQGD